MKKLHAIKLKGILYDCTTEARTDQAESVTSFMNKDAGIKVIGTNNDDVKGVWVITPKQPGGYPLDKHPTQNYYYGVCNGIKVQISLKKIVGELRAWY